MKRFLSFPTAKRGQVLLPSRGQSTSGSTPRGSGREKGKGRASGGDAIAYACFNGDVPRLRKLLATFPRDKNWSDRSGATPLLIACQRGQTACVQLLLRARANITHQMPDGTSPLIIACFNGHQECVSLLLQDGAPTSQVWEDGATALCIACQNGRAKCVQLLVDAEVQLSHIDAHTT